MPAARATRQFRLLALNGLASQAQSTALEPSALAILKGLMKDPDIEIRRAATGVMARSRDAAVAALVLDGINDQDEGIRTAAVIAAGVSPDRLRMPPSGSPWKICRSRFGRPDLKFWHQGRLKGQDRNFRCWPRTRDPEIRRPAVAAFLEDARPR